MVATSRAALPRCVWPGKAAAEVGGPGSEHTERGWGWPQTPGQCLVWGSLLLGACWPGSRSPFACRHSSQLGYLSSQMQSWRGVQANSELAFLSSTSTCSTAGTCFTTRLRSASPFKPARGTWTCSLSRAAYSGHRLQGEVRKSLSK